jgi:hypothetical protein
MNRIQATPRVNPTIGGLADLLAASYSPQRTQQLQGLMKFLGVPDVAQTLDRISYGEPITTGRGMTTELRPEAKSTLGALLGLVPIGRAAAPAAEAATMAAGRAGERVAERVVPQVMERGGLPAEMLGAMAQGTQSPATVFHGTPHLFRQFDSSKIGTGEGAQVYGHGLYLAENPAVAQQYKEALSEPELFLKNRQIQTRAGTPMDTAKAWLQDVYDRGFFSSKTANPFDQAIKDVQAAPVPKKDEVIAALNKLKERNVSMKPGGNLMQVDLPDEQIARMIDWDKPMNEKEMISLYESLDKVDPRFAMEFQDSWYRMNESTGKGLDGQDVYMALMNNLKTPQSVAQTLKEAGIPGIRYLDEGSRGAGQGTSNFVVFPGMEDMLRIEQINNQPIESLFQNLGR